MKGAMRDQQREAKEGGCVMEERGGIGGTFAKNEVNKIDVR